MCSGGAAFAVQGAGHALKIEASDLGNILASCARLFMAIDLGVGAGVILPELYEIASKALIDKGSSLDAGALLLPGGQGFLTLL